MAAGRIKVDSIEVALAEGGTGEPVVLVHGLLSDGRALLDATRTLAGRFRVLAPDLPGFGGSDKPRSYLYSPEGFGAFVVRLARALGLARYAVVGAGSGRAAAAAAARRDPDRVVMAAALREPLCAVVLARTLLSRRQSYAARKLAETLLRGGARGAGLPAFERTGELAAALAEAFARARQSAADERVDEAAERERAEELDQKDKARRRLRVLN
ncbi:MAG TPA: alpha/beta fold hydrolase [Polyangia bacterium]|nr:alpha/beta fold hydrolase [Polyangia bacterium]